MSYDKDDFVSMVTPSGGTILVNLSKIKFVTQAENKCRVFFGSGEDDYVVVKGDIDDFMEIL